MGDERDELIAGFCIADSRHASDDDVRVSAHCERQVSGVVVTE